MTLFTYVLVFGWQYIDTIMHMPMSLKYLMKYIKYYAGKKCIFIVCKISGLFEQMALRHSLKTLWFHIIVSREKIHNHDQR